MAAESSLTEYVARFVTTGKSTAGRLIDLGWLRWPLTAAVVMYAVAALLLPVHQRNPDHPGAMHYLVHAYDTPGRER